MNLSTICRQAYTAWGYHLKCLLLEKWLNPSTYNYIKKCRIINLADLINWFNRFKLYLIRYANWKYVPIFIMGFIVLSIVAALSLAAGWIYLAESIADIAYFVLVIGVILQLLFFKKHKTTNEAAL